MQKFLIIQTAFIGDVVLATAMAEKLSKYYPGAFIDYLVRKGNESLLSNNPNIRNVLIWDKNKNKRKNLFKVLRIIRSNKYDKVINLQRYFSTGFITAFSGARQTVGFDKNPMSFLFSKVLKHEIDHIHPRHEVDRNNDLIKAFTDEIRINPVLYPSMEDNESVKAYVKIPFVTMTPSSVWFTKKYPVEKWIDLIDYFNADIKIYLLGGNDNISECEMIRSMSKNKNVELLAGKLSFLQSSALMKKALMNYVNDSAPLHFASAVNAPVTAIYCSTVPSFGFTPLSETSFIIETPEQLACRPCGLHGRNACPLNHFKCAYGITTEQLLKSTISDAV